jgi:hypothetical protein
MPGKQARFPTAKSTGSQVVLGVQVENRIVSGETVGEFLYNVVAFLHELDRLASISLPFSTSGTNILLSTQPIHADGRQFNSKSVYERKGLLPLYININHPRFFALRQGARLIEAAGLTGTPIVEPSDRTDERRQMRDKKRTKAGNDTTSMRRMVRK